jgi:Domain of unknown function (DUF4384)
MRPGVVAATCLVAGLAVLLIGRATPTLHAADGDLDARLEALLTTLKQELVRQDPAWSSARAVVTNFTAEGLPWSTPLAAHIQERAAWLMEARAMFRPAAVARTRGITVKQVTGVDTPNDPKALTGFYGSDLAIDGTSRRDGDRVLVRLVAVDGQGRTVAQVSGAVPLAAFPEPVTAAQVNAEHTSDMLNAFGRLGPRAQGAWRVEVTTNRPGTGASFRQGEGITYIVSPTTDGFLYLFHVDADRKMVRIFPNQHQRDAQVRAGLPIEVPAPGAPFRFEASPPFGLETTFAVVTPAPLDEKDFQPAEGGFTKLAGEVPALVAATRGLRGKPAGPPPSPGAGPAPADRPVVWNSITILIRP